MENLSTKCVVVKKEVIAISALLQRKKKKWWGFSVKSQCYKGWKPCITWTVINLFIWKFLGLNWWWLFNTAFIIILKNGTKNKYHMRNWHDEHVHWNNKIKEREKQLLQPNKKNLANRYQKRWRCSHLFQGYFRVFYNQKKNPQKVGENLKKSSFVFFGKKEKIPMFSVVRFVPPFPISFKRNTW